LRLRCLESPAAEFISNLGFISCDPDEMAAPIIVDHVGADSFIWTTDYPHPDHPKDWRTGLEQFVAPLSEETARQPRALIGSAFSGWRRSADWMPGTLLGGQHFREVGSNSAMTTPLEGCRKPTSRSRHSRSGGHIGRLRGIPRAGHHPLSHERTLRH
jgi:hypothetical protein